jgi:hypothetical protein
MNQVRTVLQVGSRYSCLWSPCLNCNSFTGLKMSRHPSLVDWSKGKKEKTSTESDSRRIWYISTEDSQSSLSHLQGLYASPELLILTRLHTSTVRVTTGVATGSHSVT